MAQVRMYDHDVCDFCSSSEIYAVFPARDFTYVMIDEITLNSQAGWYSCRDCAKLVEAENWTGLRDNAIKQFVAKYGNDIPVEFLRREIEKLLATFRQNRLKVH
jgi:hypothetical protein